MTAWYPQVHLVVVATAARFNLGRGLPGPPLEQAPTMDLGASELPRDRATAAS